MRTGENDTCIRLLDTVFHKIGILFHFFSSYRLKIKHGVMCFKLFTPDVRTKRFNYKSYTLHTVYKYNRYKITIPKLYYY